MCSMVRITPETAENPMAVMGFVDTFQPEVLSFFFEPEISLEFCTVLLRDKELSSRRNHVKTYISAFPWL